MLAVTNSAARCTGSATTGKGDTGTGEDCTGPTAPDVGLSTGVSG
jgi:hypothetical protein